MSEERNAVTLEPLAPVMEMIAHEGDLASLTNSVKVLLEQVKGVLPQYNATNYNEDNIDEARTDRALLNKFSKALNDKRIAYEKEYMKPLEELKAIVNETTGLIKETVDTIDKVVKEEEEKGRAARRKVIDEIWAGMKFDLFPLDRVFRPEWLNKSTSKKAIVDALAKIVSDTRSNIGLLFGMVTEADQPAIHTYYLDCLDFQKSVAYVQRLKVQREENERREAARRAAEEEARNAPPPEPPANYRGQLDNARQEAVDAAIQPSQTKAVSDMYVRVFRVEGTRDQIIALGNFMKNQGIHFEKVEPK